MLGFSWPLALARHLRGFLKDAVVKDGLFLTVYGPLVMLRGDLAKDTFAAALKRRAQRRDR